MVTKEIKCWFVADEHLVYMYDVNSSNVSSIGYDEETQTLYVEFNSGDVYEYHNVPVTLWEGLKNAESKGSFLHWFIKVADYDYDITDDDNLISASMPLIESGTSHPEGYIVKG